MDIYSVKEAQRLSILHWNYRNYKEFPEELKYFGKYVQDLYLKGNQICKLPKWLPNLENMSELYISGNKLKTLPEEISCLKLLTVLDVSCNRITCFPVCITKMTKLQKLCLDKNNITVLPKDIGKLKTLYYLYVSKNEICVIPDSIGECTGLQEINLDFNRLTSLPYSMVYLPNLRYVSVRHNQLLYLPFIPFKSRPSILCGNNPYMNYVSFSILEFINEKYLPIDEDGTRWNFYNERVSAVPGNLVSRNKVIQILSTKNYVIMPRRLKVFTESHCINVPTLYELVLRSIYFQFNSKFRSPLTKQVLEFLPLNIKKGLDVGPLVLCDNCHTMLFFNAILSVFFIQIPRQRYIVMNKYVIALFCSTYCCRTFKFLQISKHNIFEFTELEWNEQYLL